MSVCVCVCVCVCVRERVERTGMASAVKGPAMRVQFNTHLTTDRVCP